MGRVRSRRWNSPETRVGVSSEQLQRSAHRVRSAELVCSSCGSVGPPPWLCLARARAPSRVLSAVLASAAVHSDNFASAIIFNSSQRSPRLAIFIGSVLDHRMGSRLTTTVPGCTSLAIGGPRIGERERNRAHRLDATLSPRTRRSGPRVGRMPFSTGCYALTRVPAIFLHFAIALRESTMIFASFAMSS